MRPKCCTSDRCEDDDGNDNEDCYACGQTVHCDCDCQTCCYCSHTLNVNLKYVVCRQQLLPTVSMQWESSENRLINDLLKQMIKELEGLRQLVHKAHQWPPTNNNVDYNNLDYNYCSCGYMIAYGFRSFDELELLHAEHVKQLFESIK